MLGAAPLSVLPLSVAPSPAVLVEAVPAGQRFTVRDPGTRWRARHAPRRFQADEPGRTFRGRRT